MDHEKDGIRSFEPAIRSGNGRRSANSGLSRDAGRPLGAFGCRVRCSVLGFFLLWSGLLAAAEYRPAVFAVGNEYQILVPVTEPAMMYVKVNGRTYHDSSNGILRSRPGVRRMSVPMAELDKAGKYTIGARAIPQRIPYAPKTSFLGEKEFSFRPVQDKEELNFLFLSDVHRREKAALGAGKSFGDKLDFLILGGDLVDDNGEAASMEAPCRLGWEITHGTVPVVNLRGNHEQKGLYAEDGERYWPNRNGKFYYTFRIGPVWGVILDMGEDKNDDHRELGYCNGSDHRREVLAFLEKTAAGNSFQAPGIKHKLVLCHAPFILRYNGAHAVDSDLHPKFVKLIREKIRPDLMLFGHFHRCFFIMPGTPEDLYGNGCPAVVGCYPGPDYQTYTGMAVTLGPKNAMTFRHIDQSGFIRNITRIAGGKLEKGIWSLPLAAAQPGSFALPQFHHENYGSGHGTAEFKTAETGNGFSLQLKTTGQNANYTSVYTHYSRIIRKDYELVFNVKGDPANQSKGAVQLNGREGGVWFGAELPLDITKGTPQEIRIPVEKFTGARPCFESCQCKFKLSGGPKNVTSHYTIENVRLEPPAKHNTSQNKGERS